MGVDAQEFPGGLLRLDPVFVYVEPPSSWPLPRVEHLTLAPNISPFFISYNSQMQLSRASECSAEESWQYKEEWLWEVGLEYQWQHN